MSSVELLFIILLAISELEAMFGLEGGVLYLLYLGYEDGFS